MALKIMKKISPEYVLTQASKDVKNPGSPD